MTKSHSNYNSQEKLIALQDAAGEKLEELLQHFALDLRKSTKFYVGKCPVHGGDRDSAFNIFHSGDIVGNWRCFTHNCHKHFQPSILGFVRGLISKQKYGWTNTRDTDRECPFREAVEFLTNFVGGESIEDLGIDYSALEKNKFSSQIENIYSRSRNKSKFTLDVPREKVIGNLDIPSKYFLSRGYTKEILVKYDVGLCATPGKEMSMRAVAPIYDDNHQLVVGCTGRSIYDACPLCNTYHNPTMQKCPTNKQKFLYAKWKHNKGFPAEDFFYNYWFAKDHIQNSGVAVIVESPGNVWRLEEAGIHNSVAMFGARLSDGQRHILDKSGALTLVVLTDPDKAGTLALQEIIKSCGNSYTIHSPKVGVGDIGETEVKTIEEKLVPFIRKLEEDYQ